MIAILAGMLLPVLGKAKEKARQIACAGMLSQIAKAFQMYTLDNKEWLPPYSGSGGYYWFASGANGYLSTYLNMKEGTPALGEIRQDGSRGPLSCSSLRDVPDRYYSYGYNYWLTYPETTLKTSRYPRPGSTAISGDLRSKASLNLSFDLGDQFFAMRHAGGANIAFCDGHVEWRRSGQIPCKDVNTWASSHVFWKPIDFDDRALQYFP